VQVRIAKVPPEIGYYLAGFTDGEGSFNVSFRPRTDYPIPWKVSVSFNVSQKDRVILALFKTHLGCGTLRGRPDGVWYFEVTNLNSIVENVIPFFERFSFLSAKKKRDFAKFKQIVDLMKSGSHLTVDGIRQILEIREDMNDGGKRRHAHVDILASLIESSETTRQALTQVDDDIVRSSSRDEGSTEEVPTIAPESNDSVVNINERS
jgi:LAGLIDADG DNA endonuclease family protein